MKVTALPQLYVPAAAPGPGVVVPLDLFPFFKISKEEDKPKKKYAK